MGRLAILSVLVLVLTGCKMHYEAGERPFPKVDEFPELAEFIKINPWAQTLCTVDLNYAYNIRELFHIHGGDGTVNEVATGLVQWGLDREGLPALGVLPLGTANDFARSAAIPLDSVEALALVGSTEPVPVDLGLVGERVFVNVATGGFGTQVTLETPPPLKKALGGAAYFLTGVTKFTSIKDAFGSCPDFPDSQPGNRDDDSRSVLS